MSVGALEENEAINSSVSKYNYFYTSSGAGSEETHSMALFGLVYILF